MTEDCILQLITSTKLTRSAFIQNQGLYLKILVVDKIHLTNVLFNILN